MNKWFKGFLTVSLAATAQFQSIDAYASEQAAQKEQSDWYLHMDVKAFQNSSLADKFASEKADGLLFINTVLGEKLVEQINFITVQGNVNDDKNKVLLVQGDFSEDTSLLLNKWKELGFTNKTKFKENTIYSGDLKQLVLAIKETKDKLKQVSDEEKEAAMIIIESKEELDKVVYSAFKDEDTIVMSDNLASVKKWLDENKSWNPSKQSNVFEVVVDIEKSLLHGGVNLDEASQNYQFESISAKQLSQVSATYNESNGYAEIQVGLETADSNTADRIKSVVYGLIALKTLSTQNTAVTNLLSTIQIEQDAGNLVARLNGPIESFQALFENH